MSKQSEPNNNPGEAKLNKQLDFIKTAIADDLKLVNAGNTESLKILNLDEKLYKRIADLIKPTRSQKPDKIDEEPDPDANLSKEPKKPKFTLEPGGNTFEQVIKDVKNGRTKL